MAHRLTLSFLKTEAASGTAMALAAVAAIVVANSPWSGDYFTWLKSYHVLQLGPIRLEETISDWIKEGLMAIFFLVVEARDQIRNHARGTQQPEEVGDARAGGAGRHGRTFSGLSAAVRRDRGSTPRLAHPP